MKTNLTPAGSVKIDDLNIGDSFISIATSDSHKGERALRWICSPILPSVTPELGPILSVTLSTLPAGTLESLTRTFWSSLAPMPVSLCDRQLSPFGGLLPGPSKNFFKKVLTK